MRQPSAGQLGFIDSNLMPVAATAVVLIYLVGVLSRWDSAPWYEWVGAAGGAGGAIWFWIWDIMRDRRRGRRGSQDDGDRSQGR